MTPFLQLYSIQHNRTDQIRPQLESFKHFMFCPFLLTVVNTARDEVHRNAINHECRQLGIEVIQVYSDTPFSLCGKHHADAVNYVWQNYCIKDKAPIVGIMDGDVFLIDELELVAEDWWPIYAPRQNRQGFDYITPTVCFFNMARLVSPETIDWEGKEVAPGVFLDSGGGFYNYLLAHPRVKDATIPMAQTWHIAAANDNLLVLPEVLRDSYQEGWDVELYDERFLHYCRSSGWAPADEGGHAAKSKWVEDFVYGRINGTIPFDPPHFEINKPEYFGWGSCTG